MRTIISNYLDGAILEVDVDELVDKLYAAGYRKQSDTIREFAEKAFRVLKKLEAGYKPDSKSPCDIQPNNVFTVINIELNELAAEYGVEVE